MKQRFTTQRRSQLVQMVVNEGSISITDAAKRLDVSIETVRKDIIHLDAQGMIKKVRGGAMRIKELDIEHPVSEKHSVNIDKKLAISKRALDFIPDGASIVLDAGSTPMILAELLAKKSGYTIFTNSAPALHALLESDNDIFVLGGHLRKSSGAMLGAWTNALLENIHPDIAIIGTDACTPTGPMVTPYEEVTVKRNIFSVSQKTILLADNTKFEKTAAFLVCDWDDIDVLITDSNVSQDVLEEYQNRVMITVADRDLT